MLYKAQESFMNFSELAKVAKVPPGVGRMGQARI